MISALINNLDYKTRLWAISSESSNPFRLYCLRYASWSLFDQGLISLRYHSQRYTICSQMELIIFIQYNTCCRPKLVYSLGDIYIFFFLIKNSKYCPIISIQTLFIHYVTVLRIILCPREIK